MFTRDHALRMLDTRFGLIAAFLVLCSVASFGLRTLTSIWALQIFVRMTMPFMKNIQALMLLVPIINMLMCHAEAMDESLILSEDFDQVQAGDLSKALLGHRYISLAEGQGRDGGDAIRVAYVGMDRGSERVVVEFPLSRKVEQATLSFDVYFEDGFDWTSGGKLHGLGPKYKVTGGNARRANGWSARTMFKEGGYCTSYLYEQDTNYKWGRGLRSSKPVFEQGKWHHVDYVLQLNSIGEKNGFVHIYIDNELVVQSTEIEFRGVGGESTLIQKLLFSTFHGGNNSMWAPRDPEGHLTTNYALFDNFEVREGIEVQGRMFAESM